jgi:NADH:ubiquinone oxidoreductase subunit 3 (subunit A)
MAMENILLSPPLAIGVCLALVYGLYRLGGMIAARGKDHPGKRQPYACGEDLPLRSTQLAYHAFFRLALMFGVLHVAALVLSTLPMQAAPHRVAIVYLIATAVSVFILTGRER